MVVAASYEVRKDKDFEEYLEELDPTHPAEARYAALFHVAHLITKATETSGAGKHASVLDACNEHPVVRLLVGMIDDYGTDDQIPPFILSTLVNLSCIDPDMVIDGGGFELLLRYVSIPKGQEKEETATRNQYYAVAGVYNLSANDTCAQQLVDNGVDKILEKLTKSPNEETSRHATYTLQNLEPLRPTSATQEAPQSKSPMKRLTAMLPSKS